MKNALTIFSDKSSEAALTRARNERAAAESRIAGSEVRRSTELLQADTVADIDLIDQAIAADRRAVLICDQRIAVIEKALRQQARDRLETERAKAVKTMTALYAKRTAKGVRVEELVTELIAAVKEIKSDERVLRAAWPFSNSLPHHFSWQYDITRDLMVVLYDSLGDWLPSNVRQAISYHAVSGGSGFTQAPSNTLPSPRDLGSRLAADAKRSHGNSQKGRHSPARAGIRW